MSLINTQLAEMQTIFSPSETHYVQNSQLNLEYFLSKYLMIDKLLYLSTSTHFFVNQKSLTLNQSVFSGQ